MKSLGGTVRLREEEWPFSSFGRRASTLQSARRRSFLKRSELQVEPLDRRSRVDLV